MNADTTDEAQKAQAKLDAAKEEIIAAIEKFEQDNRDELLNAVKAAFSSKKSAGDGGPKNPGIRNALRLLVFVVVIVTLFSAAVELAALAPAFVEVPQGSELRLLLMFLAFVVALASYLASVARETVKRVRALSADEAIRRRKDLYWMATAEVPLVILGVLAIGRLLTEWRTVTLPYIDLSVSVDAFLVSCLAVILLWMALLHGRVWFLITRPWKVYR